MFQGPAHFLPSWVAQILARVCVCVCVSVCVCVFLGGWVCVSLTGGGGGLLF